MPKGSSKGRRHLTPVTAVSTSIEMSASTHSAGCAPLDLCISQSGTHLLFAYIHHSPQQSHNALLSRGPRPLHREVLECALCSGRCAVLSGTCFSCEKPMHGSKYGPDGCKATYGRLGGTIQLFCGSACTIVAGALLACGACHTDISEAKYLHKYVVCKTALCSAGKWPTGV